MDLEMLREVVPMLRQQLEKSMLDRNYVQLERDSIQNFYEISSREVNELVSSRAIYHWYYYTCSINENYLCL
jgi:growth arrest-specific protein 8